MAPGSASKTKRRKTEYMFFILELLEIPSQNEYHIIARHFRYAIETHTNNSHNNHVIIQKCFNIVDNLNFSLLYY